MINIILIRIRDVNKTKKNFFSIKCHFFFCEKIIILFPFFNKKPKYKDIKYLEKKKKTKFYFDFIFDFSDLSQLYFKYRSLF